MLKTTAIVVLVLVAALLVFAATRPDRFRIARSARISAPPERVFALLADFREWTRWSPWEDVDPAMKRLHDGAPRGAGAVYAWEGNNKVGAGRMEIVEASPVSGVRIKLDFTRPFEAHNVAEFALAPQGDATDVTWAMHGPRPYLMKLMSLVFSMDRMVGKDFERGLARLKAAAEG